MKIEKSHQKAKYLISGLFILLILVNLVLVLPKMGSFGLGILRNWDKAGLWRSARFAYSENFADYIDFLKDEIPEDALVIIPPEEVSTWALADTPTMQFFLSPRRIVNCTTVNCGSELIGQENTYILIMGLDRFPGSEIKPLADNVRMHNDTWGVYGPADGLGNGDHTRATTAARILFEEVFLSLLYFLFVLAAGYFFMSLLLPKFPPWMRFGLGYGFLTGINSFLGYLLLYFGLFKDVGNVFHVITFMTLLVIVLVVIRNRSSFNVFQDLIFKEGQFDIWVVLILFIGIGYAVLSTGTGFFETDSIVLWGVKASGIISEGLNGVITHGTNTTAYPLHIPVYLGMVRDAFGDSLPAGKLLFPLYYLSLVLVSYEFLKTRTGKNIAGLGTLVLATMPLISRHAMIGYANLAITYYLAAGVILLNKTVMENKDILSIITGIFFGFVIWTRPEGLWFSVALYILLFTKILISDHPHKWRKYLLMFLPPFLITGLWLITKNQFYNVINPAERTIIPLVRNVSGGNFQMEEFAWITGYFMKTLFDIRSWGTLGLGMIAVVIHRFLFTQVKRKPDWFTWLVSIISFLLVIGMYYVFSFDNTYELKWWLNTGFNRMIMPGAVLLWLGIVTGLSEEAKEQEEAAQ